MTTGRINQVSIVKDNIFDSKETPIMPDKRTKGFLHNDQVRPDHHIAWLSMISF